MTIISRDTVNYEEWRSIYDNAVSALSYRVGDALAREMIELLITTPCPPKPVPVKRGRA